MTQYNVKLPNGTRRKVEATTAARANLLSIVEQVGEAMRAGTTHIPGTIAQPVSITKEKGKDRA